MAVIFKPAGVAKTASDGEWSRTAACSKQAHEVTNTDTQSLSLSVSPLPLSLFYIADMIYRHS